MTKPYAERLEAAIARYDEQVEWYETHSTRDQWWFKSLQVLTLIFAALTPVLIAAGGVPKGIQAGSSAVAAVCAGMIAVFNWGANWVRFARTAEVLKSERACFDTRTSAVYASTRNDEEILDAFMSRIEAATLGETREWGAELISVAREPPAG